MKGSTLDLAYYESLNAIWKECRSLRRIDEETAEHVSCSGRSSE
ncbi:MAG: hypothetical protein ACP5QE_07455 [Conexivisphaera sp.]|jgi:hypothetical protein